MDKRLNTAISVSVTASSILNGINGGIALIVNAGHEHSSAVAAEMGQQYPYHILTTSEKNNCWAIVAGIPIAIVSCSFSLNQNDLSWLTLQLLPTVASVFL